MLPLFAVVKHHEAPCGANTERELRARLLLEAATYGHLLVRTPVTPNTRPGTQALQGTCRREHSQGDISGHAVTRPTLLF